jgi:ATP synthase F0 subunit b
MRWFPITAAVLLFGLLLGPTADRARGEERAEGEKRSKVYVAEGGREFDLDNPKDEQALIDTLKNEDVNHLTLKTQRTKLEDMADLAIWTILVFIVVLIVLGRYAWKPILDGLHKREENIQAAVEDARRARDEAQQMRNQLQQEMARSEAKVQQMIEEGRRNAQRNADELIAKAKAEAQAERQRLHREIETARDQALQQIWSQAATLAAAVSSKAIRRELTPEDHRRLVDEALVEFQQARRDGLPA